MNLTNVPIVDAVLTVAGACNLTLTVVLMLVPTTSKAYAILSALSIDLRAVIDALRPGGPK